MQRWSAACVCTALTAAGCATSEPAQDEPPAESQTPAPAEPPEVDEEDEDEGHGFFVGLLLYIPNRILDLGDIPNVGVEVGPGMGIDLRATEYGQLALLSRISAGIGFQGFRHLPIKLGADAALGVGFLGGTGSGGLGWKYSKWDFLVDVQVILVGAHVAIDPVAIFDFVVGFVGFDPSDDDL
jgi:hypothetical protein